MTKALDIIPGQFTDIIGKTMLFDLRPEKKNKKPGHFGTHAIPTICNLSF